MNQNFIVMYAVIFNICLRPYMVYIYTARFDFINVYRLSAISAFSKLRKIQKQCFAAQTAVSIISKRIKFVHHFLNVRILFYTFIKFRQLFLPRIGTFFLLRRTSARHFNKYFLRYRLFCLCNVINYLKSS